MLEIMRASTIVGHIAGRRFQTEDQDLHELLNEVFHGKGAILRSGDILDGTCIESTTYIKPADANFEVALRETLSREGYRVREQGASDQ